ncbi:MAG: hypothetical protein AB1427_07020 [Thermodesulfobacteriota bacterium]
MLKKLKIFTPNQIKIVNNSVALAEELVSDHYKMSASQWLRPKYDVKTLTNLSPEEIVHGPFAQIIRYKGRRNDKNLESSTYDFYKICLQDHFILSAMKSSGRLKLFPFMLYIVAHELIHIVRFSKFLQNFNASPPEMLAEETRVHETTHEILKPLPFKDLPPVLEFYEKWRTPIDGLQNP